MGLGLTLGVVCAPLQVLVGDWAAKVVAQTQPIKLAAMEGQFRTEVGAPLRIGGIPNEDARVTHYAIELPGLLSWLAYSDTTAVVRGLDAFPREDTPPVAVVHIAFQLMVGIGMGLLALALWTVVGVLRRAVRHQTVWGAVFALASTATPFFLGASIGALSSGKLAVTAEGNYTGDYLWGWLSPLAIFSAFFAVGLCAYLAAVYLTWEADRRRETELVQLWRQRAIATGGWMGLLATGGLVFLALETPPLWEGFRLRAWPMIGVSVVAGLFSLWALVRRHFTAAFLGAPCTVATVIWGWGLAQYPLLVPPTLTLEAAKSPEGVLWFLVYSVAAGSVFLVPALGYLFYLFKGQRPA